MSGVEGVEGQLEGGVGVFDPLDLCLSSLLQYQPTEN